MFLNNNSERSWFYKCIKGVIYWKRCNKGNKWNNDEENCDKYCKCKWGILIFKVW